MPMQDTDGMEAVVHSTLTPTSVFGLRMTTSKPELVVQQREFTSDTQ